MKNLVQYICILQQLPLLLGVVYLLHRKEDSRERLAVFMHLPRPAGSESFNKVNINVINKILCFTKVKIKVINNRKSLF